jgi:hypothetical protein
MFNSRRDLLRNLGLVCLHRAGLATPRWAMLAGGISENSVNDLLSKSKTGNDTRAEDAPHQRLRMEICLNGMWEVVRNPEDMTLPQSGWKAERAPAMPIITETPTTSAWYRYRVETSQEWSQPNRQFFLRLEKAGHYAAIYWNKHLVAEHYGQYTPIEADVSEFIHPGEVNEISIFVHSASGKYVRPGAEFSDRKIENAYRAATSQEFQRNWIGVVGDISLGWRPVLRIADVFVITSVRQNRLQASIAVSGYKPPSSGLKLRAAVLDGTTIIHELPERPVSGEAQGSLETDWHDPILWGPEPYGKAKLYVLRTELLKDGKLLDRSFTRFGFREVWIEGVDVLLNGKKLWMAGTYFEKLAPVIYLNDRHPQAYMTEIMQASGLNTLHCHWDSLGETWLNLCDEAGMMVLGCFFCDGRPDLVSQADPGWADWMSSTCADWVQTVRNHPSIVMWRPTDMLPDNMTRQQNEIYARLAEQVRKKDGTRPVADGSDIQGWGQSSLLDQSKPGDDFEAWVHDPRRGLTDSRVYDDGSRMAKILASSQNPFLAKEIYTGYTDVPKLSGFFRTFYEKSVAGKGTGVIVQYLPLLDDTDAFDIVWLSESGKGNRDPQHVSEVNLPNWSDPRHPVGRISDYSVLFANLYREIVKLAPEPYKGEISGEVLISGLSPGELVFLLPAHSLPGDALGIRAASDGSGWAIGVAPGVYVLHCRAGAVKFNIRPQRLPERPGYAFVQRTTAPGLPASAADIEPPSQAHAGA